MTALAATIPILPPTDAETMERIFRAEDVSRLFGQVSIHTDHLIHAGMYARTVTMPAHTALIGVHIKIPTVVITVGKARVLIGSDWAEVDGYQVLPASADRKQIFVSLTPFVITMMFPTDAKTVEEAEAAFTDDADSLLSRWQGFNVVNVTGE